jgi:hypothetical protein
MRYLLALVMAGLILGTGTFYVWLTRRSLQEQARKLARQLCRVRYCGPIF